MTWVWIAVSSSGSAPRAPSPACSARPRPRRRLRRATTSPTCSGARPRSCSRSRSGSARSRTGEFSPARRAPAARRARRRSRAPRQARSPCSARTRRPRTTSRSRCPPARFRTEARILNFGARSSSASSGVYLDGVARTTDQPTRLLLGRLLISDGQHLTMLRGLAGDPLADDGLRNPVRVETGRRLDRPLPRSRRSRPGDAMRRLLLTAARLLAAPTAAQAAPTVYAAASLREAFPRDRPRADLQLRRLQPAAGADRARRARRRVRLREPDRGRRRCSAPAAARGR